MSKDTRTLQPWQIERAKQRGTRRTRAIALAMFQPMVLRPAVTGARLPDILPMILEQDLAPPQRHSAAGPSAPPDRSMTLDKSSDPATARHSPAKEDLMPNPDKLKDETASSGPLGHKMATNISPGNLMADPGETLRELIGEGKEPDQFAGRVWGVAFYGIELPSEKFPGQKDIRWHGEFGWENRLGVVGQGATVYLPGSVERDLLAGGAPVLYTPDDRPRPFRGTFAVDFWIERVSRKVSGKGYVYAAYNRAGRRHDINALAPPEVQAKLAPQPVSTRLLGYDGETGEVLDASDARIDDDRFAQPHHGHTDDDGGGRRDAAE